MSLEALGLRDYFAARAPEVPDWFTPNMDHLVQVPEEPKTPAVMSLGDPAHEEKRAAWQKAKARAESVQTEYRFICWRWYYADQMLALRDRVVFNEVK